MAPALTRFIICAFVGWTRSIKLLKSINLPLVLRSLIIVSANVSPIPAIAEYPKRILPEGACVTRFAPSPTGFMHLGGLFQAIINYVIAKRQKQQEAKNEQDGTTPSKRRFIFSSSPFKKTSKIF